MNLKSKPVFVIISIIVTLIAVTLAIPFMLRSNKSSEVYNLTNLKCLGIGLISYAEQHAGLFPDAISEIPTDSIPVECRHFFDYTTMESKEWIYYKGHTMKDPPEILLAASPVAVRWRGRMQRMVLCNDTVVTFIEESEFQKKLLSDAPR